MKLLIMLGLFIAAVVSSSGQSDIKSTDRAAESNLHFFFDGSGFSTTGKWEPSDPKDKLAYPTETIVECSKARHQCVQATAEYYDHAHASLDYFEIDRWDENGIIASSSDAICMTQNVVISFGDKSLTQTFAIKPMSPNKKKACAVFGAEGTRVETFVIKNSKRWLEDQVAGRN